MESDVTIEYWIQPCEHGEKINSEIKTSLDEMTVDAAEKYLVEGERDKSSPIQTLMDENDVFANFNYGVTRLRNHKQDKKINTEATPRLGKKTHPITAKKQEEDTLLLGGHTVTHQSILSYIQFIGFGMTGVGKELIFNYEAERCRLHQGLFAQAGQDRTKDRGTDFAKKMDDLVCHALCCPYCEISMGIKNVCNQCDHKLKKADVFNFLENVGDKYT